MYFGKISIVCANSDANIAHSLFAVHYTLRIEKNIHSRRTCITIRNFTSFDLPRSHIISTPWHTHLFIIIYNVDYIFFLLSVIMAEG